MTRRRALLLALLGLALAALVTFAVAYVRTPDDRTPQGAYLRIAKAVSLDKPELFFAYLETSAQHACFTIRTYRRQARDRVLAAYPEPDRTRLADAWAAEATAPDGADVFALEARRRGFVDRLRRDLSGVAKVEIRGERASIETANGARYPFRRRENGIWGLTLFTADLTQEAEKAARDAAIIEKAAQDYERATKSLTAARPDGG